MAHQQAKGSLLGGILLITGCCIGAGMLGLPVLSAMAGFMPSLLMLLLGWAYMACTGLLLLEINLCFPEEVNIVSMAQRTFGVFGKLIAWLMFLFLFYCLMVAYTAASGELAVDFIKQLTGIPIHPWIGAFFFSFTLGILLFIGTHAIDHFNRVLMIGLVVTYLLLIVLGIPHIDTNLLKHRDWGYATWVLPVMIISFGYHNLIPSLTHYFRRDVQRMRLAILIGSGIPLIVYLLWEGLILGLVPIEGPGGLKEAVDKEQIATHVLHTVTGFPWVVNIAQAFAFFAITTSFVGVALSFVDFLADGLRVKKTAFSKVYLCFLALVPPFILALIYPQIFLTALNYAGGIGAVILFGILPAAMVWSGRYIEKISLKPLVPGGKVMLGIIMLFSLGILMIQLIIN